MPFVPVAIEVPEGLVKVPVAATPETQFAAWVVLQVVVKTLIEFSELHPWNIYLIQ